MSTTTFLGVSLRFRSCLWWWLFVRSISGICVPYTAPHNGCLIAIDGRWRQITSQAILYIQPACLKKGNTPEHILSFFGNFYEKKFPTPPSSWRQHLISGRKRQSQHVLFSHYPWKFAKEKNLGKVNLTFLKPLKHKALIPHLKKELEKAKLISPKPLIPHLAFGIWRLKDIVSHSRLLLKLFKRGRNPILHTWPWMS